MGIGSGSREPLLGGGGGGGGGGGIKEKKEGGEGREKGNEDEDEDEDDNDEKQGKGKEEEEEEGEESQVENLDALMSKMLAIRGMPNVSNFAYPTSFPPFSLPIFLPFPFPSLFCK